MPKRSYTRADKVIILKQNGHKKTTRNFAPANGKRVKVVRGVIEGKTNAQMAADTGLSERRIQQIKAEPETIGMVDALIDKHRAEIEAGFAESLQSARTDLKDDFYAARASARGDILKIVQMGQPKDKAASSALPTLTQINILIQQHGSTR